MRVEANVVFDAETQHLCLELRPTVRPSGEIDYEDAVNELFERGEAMEGLRAFLDKRAPQFA